MRPRVPVYPVIPLNTEQSTAPRKLPRSTCNPEVVSGLLHQKASAGALLNARLSLPATGDTPSLSTCKCTQNPSNILLKPSQMNQSAPSSLQWLSLSGVKVFPRGSGTTTVKLLSMPHSTSLTFPENYKLTSIYLKKSKANGILLIEWG